MSEKWKYYGFPSGTTIVSRRGDEPHYYVYANEPVRYNVCSALRDFLNRGHRPSWLDGLRRDGDTAVENGHIRIFTTGPYVEAGTPGQCLWKDDPAEHESRKALIDNLLVGTLND